MKFLHYQTMHSPNVLPAVSPRNSKRINLILPANYGWSGGPETCIRLFKTMSQEFDQSRVILLFHDDRPLNSLWQGWVMDAETVADRSMLFIRDSATPLHVFEGDYFVATYWPAAVYAKNVILKQRELHPNAAKRFVYFIQDYEPGFYPWSEDFNYAASTYDDETAIAVIGTKRLHEFFLRSSIHFRESYIFEPRLNPALAALRSDLLQIHKEKLILVYVRPNVPRNGFDLAVNSLTEWAKTYVPARSWKVVSAGDSHEDIPLANGAVLRSLGPLQLGEYASYLARSWIGLSFMFLPHPGYPRFEMAEFGAWVVTNKFPGNDLADLTPTILPVGGPPYVKDVADKLSWCCDQFQEGRTSASAIPPCLFSQKENEFPELGQMLESWLRSG